MKIARTEALDIFDDITEMKTSKLKVMGVMVMTYVHMSAVYIRN